MKVGKHHLALTHQRILWLNGFLHLDYHVSLRIDILYGRQYLRADPHISIVAEPAALACCVLHKDSMSMFNQLGNARRCHAHTVLVVLNFLGNSYFHHSLGIFVVKHN